ncbi:MAG: N-acetyl-alpha-D-glucosaminyl L-malate synthase BshA [Opitutaceae bacterium]|nr:N-acetyl-alpha-D-glucosaminyl L-malate synthase BshA [Opitutaceae bacterium]
MTSDRPLRIGITCYPSVGGSGILASELGEELARRGHEVHFISYQRPFRLPAAAPRIFFHPVVINDYELFKYPDYTLPLSVKMAEVARDHQLDLLHVHYAVPHATAAILARSMLPDGRRPRVVTTLHGTDTTLLGRDPGYGPAIRHALAQSDAITTVSEFLRVETVRLLGVSERIDVVHNFFEPQAPARNADEVRRELKLGDELVVFHASNMRPVKRVDLLLDSIARLRTDRPAILLLLAGADFSPYVPHVQRRGLRERVLVREKVVGIEDYLQVADAAMFTSESESFCLSALEAMSLGVPCVARRVGGIPEVIEDGVSGVLVDSDEPHDLAAAMDSLLGDRERRLAMGAAAKTRARALFSAEVIVPRYEAVYRRVCAT